MELLKKIKDIVLTCIGIFSLIGAIVMISEDITATIVFGLISIFCFFFSKNLFINSINNFKKERELKSIQSDADFEVKKKKFEIEKDFAIQRMEIEKQKFLNKSRLEAQKQHSITNELASIENLPDGYAFEEYTANLLKKLNYTNVSVTSSSNDYGIDVLAEKNGIKYAIQCKLYSQPVGNKAVQEAFSGKNFYNCHIAVVLTNNTFTENAKNLAKSNGVLLWDKDILQKMIEEASMKAN